MSNLKYVPDQAMPAWEALARHNLKSEQQRLAWRRDRLRLARANLAQPQTIERLQGEAQWALDHCVQARRELAAVVTERARRERYPGQA